MVLSLIHILMLAFLAGAVLVMGYGVWQYTHIVDMATDMATHDWVDASRFPMLYRRFYSTLENPNLCATYLLMMTSYSGAFVLFEKRRRQKGLLLLLTMGLVVCLALTYSRGAWISLLFILAVYGLEYDKRLFALLLLVPVILFFYQGQVAVRFLSCLLYTSIWTGYLIFHGQKKARTIWIWKRQSRCLTQTITDWKRLRKEFWNISPYVSCPLNPRVLFYAL